MAEAKKYRLGNQPEEYELKEDFLGWVPESGDWTAMHLDYIKNVNLTIVDPTGMKKKSLFLHHFIIKDAFPLSFFREARARDWSHFAIVSENKTAEQFIIPLD